MLNWNAVPLFEETSVVWVKDIMGISRFLSQVVFEAVRKYHLSRHHFIEKKLVCNAGDIKFRCNICGNEVLARLVDICDRDKESCRSCGSNLRYRTIIHILSLELFGKSVILPEYPENKNINGLGMSDWEGYSVMLAEKLSYTNTYYHKDPKLDIVKVKPEMENLYDFITSSDVFEHILSPVSVGFENMYKLLRGKGLCVFTVPFVNLVNTWEHFPELNDFDIIFNGKGNQILINTTKKGEKQEYENLIFHGGKGATLEMRIFSKPSLLKEFHAAGFSDVKFHKCDKPEFGIIWPINWSLPISARVNKESNAAE